MEPAPLIPPTVQRTIDLIVVHCSATPSGQWLLGHAPGSADYRTAVAVIDDWHAQRGFHREEKPRQAFNWRLRAIGYHYVIDLDGRVWTGRHLDEIGAHVQGHNATSVGICMVGGAERDARYTQEQWAALQSLVEQLRQRFYKARICGHRDLSPDADGDGQVEPREWLKTCPGFDVSAWLKDGPRADQIIEVQ